jgi:hypothetical protein
VPITAKLSNKFYEKLGDDVADAPEEFDTVKETFFAPSATLTRDPPSWWTG